MEVWESLVSTLPETKGRWVVFMYLRSTILHQLHGISSLFAVNYVCTLNLFSSSVSVNQQIIAAIIVIEKL